MTRRILWLCAVLSLVGVAVANILQLARDQPLPRIDFSGASSDPVLRAQERFGAVRQQLHERRLAGHIGYFSDTPAGQLSQTPRGIERYFLAQFALAPLILDGDGRDEWIVTDFETTARDLAARVPAGYELAADCGGGVRLYHRPP